MSSSKQVEKNVPKDENMKGSRVFKLKIVLLSALLLAVIALFAAVCTTIAVLSVSIARSHSLHTQTDITLEDLAAMRNELVQQHRLERRSRPSSSKGSSSSTNREKSCYSLMTNDSHPAAHITGTGQGIKWTVKNIPSPSNNDPFLTADAWGYKSHWMCTEQRGAFVDGGMYFNQTDKKLYVPKCGYYYISSQMYFDYTPMEQQQFVSHQLRVERNCGGEDDTLQLESISSLGETNKMSKTSTFLGDIVQICAGGKISMNVPVREDRSPCCPGGMESITYFSAYLMKEMGCGWTKDRILTTPPTQQDYDKYYNSHQ